jgi:outer membrane protein assembly factor BamB
MSPSITDSQKVIVGTAKGDLSLFDGKDGTRIWRSQTYNGKFPSERPAITDDIICTVLEDFLVAYNAKDGTKEWEYNPQHPVGSSPLAADGAIFFGDNGGSVYALNQDTGERLWVFEGSGYITTQPVYLDQDSHLLVATSSSLYLLDAYNGERKASTHVGGDPQQVHTFRNSIVVSEIGGEVTRYDVDSLSPDWNWIISGRLSASYRLLEADATLYLSNDDQVFAVNLRTGETRWSYNSVRKDWGSLTTNGEYIFVRGDDNTLTAFTPEGYVEWEYSPDRPEYNFHTPPTATTDSVYIGAPDCVLSLDAQTGKNLWHMKPNSSALCTSGELPKTCMAHDPQLIARTQTSFSDI